MKFNFILLLFCLCSCSIKEYSVTQFELQNRLLKDQKYEDSFFWRYQGSDNIYHYFTRNIMSFGFRDKYDGLYKIEKKDFELRHPEILYSEGNGAHLRSFTYIEGLRFDKCKYDIRIGVTPQLSPIPCIPKGANISDRQNWYVSGGRGSWLDYVEARSSE